MIKIGNMYEFIWGFVLQKDEEPHEKYMTKEKTTKPVLNTYVVSVLSSLISITLPEGWL